MTRSMFRVSITKSRGTIDRIICNAAGTPSMSLSPFHITPEVMNAIVRIGSGDYTCQIIWTLNKAEKARGKGLPCLPSQSKRKTSTESKRSLADCGQRFLQDATASHIPFEAIADSPAAASSTADRRRLGCSSPTGNDGMSLGVNHRYATPDYDINTLIV